MDPRWYEDKTFWHDGARIMFGPESWDLAAKEVEGVLRLAEIGSESRILDSFCGPGRHSLEFARRGHRVTGVDLTKTYVEAARDSAEAEDLPIRFLCADGLTFQEPEGFDLAVNLYTSFGYFQNPVRELQYVTNLCGSLRPGGKLFIDTISKETWAKTESESFTVDRGDFTIDVEARPVEDYEILETRWVLRDKSSGNRKELSFRHRLYSGREMKELLISAGFSRVRLFGTWDGGPYDHQAQRLLVLAVK